MLGVLAHPGGLIVERPELTVGVLRVISRPTGMEIELLARRPRDRRTALERQAVIRARRDGKPVAARRLLPQHDEGENLRFGWLDGDGRAHWSYPLHGSYDSGGTADDGWGPTLRAVYQIPPLFDGASFVLAWPEIGFPETVIRMDLPDRATAERDAVSIWEAPVHVSVVPGGSLTYRDDEAPTTQVAIEGGQAVATPRVLHRSEHAVVVLTRLAAVGPLLSMQVRSVARGDVARSITAEPPPRRRRSGASIAVLQGGGALWLRPHESMASGGPQAFEDTAEFTLSQPDGDALDLVVAWDVAGLPEARVTIPINRS
jgi:hypothetical protein